MQSNIHMTTTIVIVWLITKSSFAKEVLAFPQKWGWSALNNNDWHALKIESSLAGDEGSTSSSTHIVGTQNFDKTFFGLLLGSFDPTVCSKKFLKKKK